MKSVEEIAFDEALDDYSNKFGENYPLVVTSMLTTEEIIKDIRRCIAENKKKKQPKFKPGVDY